MIRDVSVIRAHGIPHIYSNEHTKTVRETAIGNKDSLNQNGFQTSATMPGSN